MSKLKLSPDVAAMNPDAAGMPASRGQTGETQ